MMSLKSLCTGLFAAIGLLLIGSIQAQDLDICPSNITDEDTCGEACGGSSFDFVVLAEATSDDQNAETVSAVYTGFNCECAESSTPVSCTSTYDFPTCTASNVTDCTTGKCADYCVALGFTVWFCTTEPELACECEADALVDNGTIAVSSMYVCGDEGWTPQTSAAPSAKHLLPWMVVAAGVMTAVSVAVSMF